MPEPTGELVRASPVNRILGPRATVPAEGLMSAEACQAEEPADHHESQAGVPSMGTPAMEPPRGTGAREARCHSREASPRLEDEASFAGAFPGAGAAVGPCLRTISVPAEGLTEPTASPWRELRA